MTPPKQCRTLAEVRSGIDELDERIVALLGTRFRFMEAAARIKCSRDEVRDERRKADVIGKVRSSARQARIPENLVAELYERLIEASIAYEFDRFDGRSTAG